jgi:hypothetical protein
LGNLWAACTDRHHVSQAAKAAKKRRKPLLFDRDGVTPR